MYKMSVNNSGANRELKKLYDLLEKVRSTSLGADYKTRSEMKEMADKIVEKIKEISSTQYAKMDANHSQKDSQ